MVECMTVNLVTIWYIASAILALISSFIIDNFLIQFGIFAIVGTLLLITTRTTLKKLLKEKKERTNLDRIIGMKGIVTEEITKNRTGEVKVDGKYWTAVAEETIPVDTTVKILEINSTKLKVERMEE